jgi:hypothetical protein
MELYINGTLTDSLDSGLTAIQNDVNNDLRIANEIETGFGYSLSGSIDDLRIWNYRRTASQIRNNYDLKVDPSSSGLVLYWTVMNIFSTAQNLIIKGMNKKPKIA